jgi:hypothetical protein
MVQKFSYTASIAPEAHLVHDQPIRLIGNGGVFRRIVRGHHAHEIAREYAAPKICGWYELTRDYVVLPHFERSTANATIIFKMYFLGREAGVKSSTCPGDRTPLVMAIATY